MSGAFESLIERMTRAGWRPGPPATEAQILAVERRLGASLPDDYRRLLLLAGGGQPGGVEAWRALWRVENLIPMNEAFHIPANFPGLLAIANQGFLVYALDFRDVDRVPVVTLGLSSSDWSDVSLEAPSFMTWMEEVVPA